MEIAFVNLLQQNVLFLCAILVKDTLHAFVTVSNSPQVLIVHVLESTVSCVEFPNISVSWEKSQRLGG